MLKFNRLFFICFLLCMMISMSSCSSVTEKDIYGTYLAKCHFGIEIITFNLNGEYTQVVLILNDNKTMPKVPPQILSQKGHWWYDPESKYVKLKNALDVFDPIDGLTKNYQIPFNGIVLAKVRRSFPSIRLGTAYEDIDFVKIK